MKKKTTQPLVAISARVSTKEKQEVENQLHELRTWCKRMAYNIYREYIDKESGAKGRGGRKAFTEMVADTTW